MIVEHVGCCQGFLYWMSYPCVSFLVCSFGGLVGSLVVSLSKGVATAPPRAQV